MNSCLAIWISFWAQPTWRGVYGGPLIVIVAEKVTNKRALQGTWISAIYVERSVVKEWLSSRGWVTCVVPNVGSRLKMEAYIKRHLPRSCSFLTWVPHLCRWTKTVPSFPDAMLRMAEIGCNQSPAISYSKPTYMTCEQLCAKPDLLNQLYALCSLRDRTRRRQSPGPDKQKNTCYQRRCLQCASKHHAYENCSINNFRKGHARWCFKCSFTIHGREKNHPSGTYGKNDWPIWNVIRFASVLYKMNKWGISSIHDFLMFQDCPPTNNWLNGCVKRNRMEMSGSLMWLNG